MILGAAAGPNKILAHSGLARLPVVGGLAWGIPDLFTGGVGHRQRLLDDHPFPAALAPRGFRLRSDRADSDGRETFGRIVTFDGPDDRDTISYSKHGMTAGEVYDYWKDATVGFAAAGQKEPGFLVAEDLGPRSYCAADDLPLETLKHRVMCVAAFDGMAVIAESINDDPRQGSLESAVALLHAGVEHWKSIRD